MSNESSTHTMPSGRIIVGVDGSDPSVGALREASHLARALHAELVAVSAWQYPSGYGPYALGDWSPEADARRSLREAVGRAFGASIPDGLRIEVLEGPAAHALITASKGATMLVVGSRGHGGFAGMLLGSVSSACAEHAHCPVLVCHQSPPAKPEGREPADRDEARPVTHHHESRSSEARSSS